MGERARAARTRPPQPVAAALRRLRDRTETSLGRPRAQPTTHNKSDADARTIKGLSHHSLTFDHFSLEEGRDSESEKLRLQEGAVTATIEGTGLCQSDHL